MSKHPSDNTKRNLLRRSLAGILSLALLLSLLPSTLITAHAASWADPYVQTLAEWGVMRGDVGGNMDPDRSITRAEFVTMMNRAYGYTKLGGNPFTDVRVTDWYYEDVDIAYNIGYFQGTSPTTAAPNDSLTREQAAVLLARNMALEPTVGETLGFSDSRSLEEWSRGLVGAAAANGIISGYEDGTFRPAANITRGEVAAMLVRAIGTPIQTAGDHALGNVYGNVTVNTSGVQLRDGVIVGNLYLTGGIDLGDILLENITVLGEIIVSGGGESNSGQSSIIMRNVVADNMVVDSIGNQFITIRAEGNTDIPTTTVRTSAYVDDYSLPGYGLSLITLDGEEGALYQLAGNIKEVIDVTPGSSLQIVQGTADKVTMDEYATGSNVLVDGDAVVGELNLDVATNVTGTGDIKSLNVGAAGSTVEQLPDSIEIRPGITTDINGSSMNSTEAAEASADPKLLAGYPAVKNIAPTSATLVFQTNKSGTVYWAVTAVADGSVSEADLLEPPSYGNKILASGKVNATSANTDFTAAVSRLTTGGSYYVTAMLVDGRDQHSPIKVTAFSTPDNTVPAFAQGYPVMSKVTCDEAQVTVMTTKSCLLYYALLPAGAAAPTTAEFKSAAIPGNLGYGSMTVTKNVTIPFPVNNTPLDEKTNYVLYLWLTDVDGAQSSGVTRLPFTTPDETPPNVTSITQTGETVSSIKVEYTIDEPADLVWAIVTEGSHMAKQFLQWDDETFDPNDEDHSTLKFNDEASLMAAKIKLQSGTGALANGANKSSPLNITNLLTADTNTSSYVLYYIANDNATTTGNLSLQIKALRVYTLDNIKPTAKLNFTNSDGTQVTENPQLTADISIVFSENVRGGTKKGENVFLTLYNNILAAEKALLTNPDINPDDTTSDEYIAYLNAKSNLATALSTYITMYSGTPTGTHTVMKDRSKEIVTDSDTWVDWTKATVEMMDDGKVEVRLPGPTVDSNGNYDYSESGVKLDSGASYYFHLAGIYDLSVSNNPLDPSPCDLPFTTSYAKVLLTPGDELTISGVNDPDQNNNPGRIDYHFIAEPQDVKRMNNASMLWDMLIWADTSMVITVYERHDENGAWDKLCSLDIAVDEREGFAYKSVGRWLTGTANPTPDFAPLQDFEYTEYAIHIDKLKGEEDFTAWNMTASVRVSIVGGTRSTLSNNVINGSTQTDYEKALELGVLSVGTPDPFTMSKLFTDSKAPGFNTPSIDVHDTGATIRITPNRPGQVYYMIIPITNGTMYDSNGNAVSNATELTELRVKTVASYDAAVDVFAEGETEYPALERVPLMIGDPDRQITSGVDDLIVSRPIRDAFIDSTEYPNVIKGSTDSVPGNTQVQIDLSGQLQYNTVYLVCLLTRGVSAVYSDDIYCYRFTTNMPERPILTLQNTGNATIDATVDRTSPVQSVLLINTNLASNTILMDSFENYIQPGLEDAYKDWAANNAVKDTGASNYTILKALKDNYQPGVSNNRYPSVFDWFASDSLKDQIMTMIDVSGTGTLVKAYSPAQTITVSGNATTNKATLQYKESQLQQGVTYVCLAMAGSGTVESRGFRSDYPITLVDDSAPGVSSVVAGLSPNDDNTKVSGSITVVFTRGLYRYGLTDTTTLFPVIGTSTPNTEGTTADSGSTKVIGYGANIAVGNKNYMTIEPSTAFPITSVTVDISETAAMTFEIIITGGAFYGESGTPMPATVVQVNVTDRETGTYTVVIK